MNVSLLQLDIQWGNPEGNIRQATALMDAQPHADLFVLPEMWATGFITEPTDIVKGEQEDRALAWMKQEAKKRSCAICGSLAIKLSEQDYRNRSYFVTPDGVSFYDKHHLFTHGHEDKYYIAGKQHTIVEWQGVRFLLLTCYDLRFPVWSRYGIAGEYDAMIYVANWPQSRQEAWNILTHARAIENQSFVIAVNRVGNDPYTSYQGGSIMIDPIGRDLIKDEKHTELSLVGQLCMDKLQKARSRFSVLADRDCLTNGIG